MNIRDELLQDVPELAHYVRRPSYFAANGFYWAVAAVFALMQLIMAPAYWLLSAVWDIDPTGYTTALQMLMYIGAILLPLVAYLLTHPNEHAAFRLRLPKHAPMAIAAVCAGVGFFAANFTTTLWLLLLEGIGYVPPAADVLTGSLWLDLLMVALLPGVCEELLFRGMIMGAYERRGTWRAIWISALLFMGLHGTVAGMPAQLMLGVGLGYAAASTGSVMVPMAIHTAYNAITVLVSRSTPVGMDAAVSMLEQVGGMAGVVVCGILAAVSVTLFVLALRWLDRCRERAGEDFGNDRVIEPAGLSRAEGILLTSAIVTVLWFYLRNILGI